MFIDPYKALNKNVKIEGLISHTDKIVNDIIAYLIEENSTIIGTNGFDSKTRTVAEKIVREKLFKEYNYGNFDVDELVKAVTDKLFGYGILQKYIDDHAITDIRAIKWNSVYVMKNGKWQKVEESFSNEVEFYNFVRYCVLKNHGKITYEQPMVVVSDKEKHLRIEAGISPVNIISPSLVIRIHRPEEQVNLQELYLNKNMMNREMYEFIKYVIQKGCNIIISGKGGSGKTTLLRAIINEIPDNVSITSNEETAELYSTHGNMIQREIIKDRAKGNILLEDLTKHSLVMSNDIIIIGEIKGSEAMAFFDGISTGHVGYATVHSESAKLVMDRLVTLMKKDVSAQQYTDKYLKDILAQSVDIIVYMRGFKIYEVCEIEFSAELGIKYNKLFEYLEDNNGENGVFRACNKSKYFGES